ncbi:hypothetical protein [Streptomyces sp. NPDC001380]|uniref:hypothetical protein n=1 Tax=Streptomyces sp. NPDC001380 TaxID=3364566 RepID=UPI00368ADDEC
MTHSGAEHGAIAELFTAPSVFLSQPKWSAFLTRRSPVLLVSAPDGTALGAVREEAPPGPLFEQLWAKTGRRFLMRDASDIPLLHVEVVPGRYGFGRRSFRFTDGGGRSVGEAKPKHAIWQSKELAVRTAEGTSLRLVLEDPPWSGWVVKDEADAVLGTVTTSTVESLTGAQRYTVESGAGLPPSGRRVVIAAVICLHLIRWPPR